MARRPPLAEQLDLSVHPEGGWFRPTWNSGIRFQPPGYQGDRAAASAIYYLLAAGEESRWHLVRSDELWLWHHGGPLNVTLGGDGPTPRQESTVTLGPDVFGGQRFQVLVPGGTWQSARPTTTSDVLVSCVVAPSFDYQDFTMLSEDTG